MNGLESAPATIAEQSDAVIRLGQSTIESVAVGMHQVGKPIAVDIDDLETAGAP